MASLSTGAIYSVPAWRTFSNEIFESYAEWYYASVYGSYRNADDDFRRYHYDDATYRDFAPAFTAERFDPARWADLFCCAGPKYDEQGIPRKVLSRSIEDYGTFIEPMLPWTTTEVYMVATLGVAYADYVPFMWLQIINFIMAPLLAITGIGCFYNEKKKKNTVTPVS